MTAPHTPSAVPRAVTVTCRWCAGKGRVYPDVFAQADGFTVACSACNAAGIMTVSDVEQLRADMNTVWWWHFLCAVAGLLMGPVCGFVVPVQPFHLEVIIICGVVFSSWWGLDHLFEAQRITDEMLKRFP
jgi:hypothetical protein